MEGLEYAAPFVEFRDIVVNLIMTGHRPRLVEDAQRAFQKVLVEGHFEISELENPSYLWIEL